MRKIFISIIGLILFSCSGSKPALKIPLDVLSDETVHSKTTDLSVKIPKDWFTAEDNECNCIDLWLVKNDYSASLIFRKINVDQAAQSELKENEVEKVAEYSKMFAENKVGDEFQKPGKVETFELNGKPFAEYRYKSSKDEVIRAVVFELNGQFYEMQALQKDKKNPDDMYDIQNAVLATLNQ